LKRCYICDREFDGCTVLDHGEHVIQNAIGGGLIAEGILCRDCGASLGESVDSKFNDALKALCAVFEIRRDRGARITVPARVTIRREFSVEPPEPKFSVERGTDPTPRAPLVVKDDAAKEAHIFGATAKQVKNYSASQTVKRLADDGYAISTCSSIGSFVERVALEIRPDSLDLARGIIKIAVSFALAAGVSPGLIRHLVMEKRDITTDETTINSAVQPYFPTGWCEALYEADRYATDAFPPNHQLVLFSLGKRLFCYVDLFGVIQRYVLLSHDWSGPPVSRRYLQKCPRWIFDPDDWKVRRPKDVMVLAQQFNVCVAGRSQKAIQAEILHRAASRPYELSAADHLEKPKTMLETLAALPMDQHSFFPATAALRKRAEVAAAEFGSNLLVNLATDRLRMFCFIRDLDVDRFRITNENGDCPDLSRNISAVALQRYQDFRLREFVRAFANSWSIEIDASTTSP
jgi:hypothetical protein